MEYTVELESAVFISVKVQASSYDEAVDSAFAALPKYPVAVTRADQIDGSVNPIDGDDITVGNRWEVSIVQDGEGNKVWE